MDYIYRIKKQEKIKKLKPSYQPLKVKGWEKICHANYRHRKLSAVLMSAKTGLNMQSMTRYRKEFHNDRVSSFSSMEKKVTHTPNDTTNILSKNGEN